MVRRKRIKITINILNGNDKSSKRDVVLLNAALALYVAEKVNDIQSGIKLARHLIDRTSYETVFEDGVSSDDTE